MFLILGVLVLYKCFGLIVSGEALFSSCISGLSLRRIAKNMQRSSVEHVVHRISCAVVVNDLLKMNDLEDN